LIGARALFILEGAQAEETMAIAVRPVHPCLGAEIGGVDLTRPVSDEDFAEIEAALNRHAVLIFHDQPLSDERQIDFSRRFGPLEVMPIYAGYRHRIRAEFADISNLDADGELLAADSDRRMFNLGNQLWHTDSSFKYVPARCSLLSAREIPSEGGDTEFADLRAAYDALPDETKRRLDGLVAEHSIFHSRLKTGFVNFTEDIRRAMPPVPQLMVRRHPGSGRKTLYLAAHASHIVGWPVEEGERLIEELIALATEPRFVYCHRWRVGDLVIWDDRCTMHRGRPYDDVQHRRVLHRTTVSDEINSVERERRGTAA
jgi:alpha-ketoglutarate-dependent 2,4-dichlorophenoxyacetate dioxygenase